MFSEFSFLCYICSQSFPFYVEFVLRVSPSMLNLIADVLQVFLISYVMNFETTCCSHYSLLSSPYFLRRRSAISLKFSPFPKKRRAEIPISLVLVAVFYFDY